MPTARPQLLFNILNTKLPVLCFVESSTFYPLEVHIYTYAHVTREHLQSLYIPLYVFKRLYIHIFILVSRH